MDRHDASRALLEIALNNGWSASYKHRTDTGGNPYINVLARRGEGERVEVCWHTRKTGTYRLFTCMVGDGIKARDTTLSNARDALTN